MDRERGRIDPAATAVPVQSGVTAASLCAEEDARQQRILSVAGNISRVDPAVVQKAFEDGVLVSVHFHWWRGQDALRLEDLGLTPSEATTEFYARAVSLGSRRLLPVSVTRAFKALETRGRTALARYAFGSAWGYFVPLTTFQQWKAEFSAVQAEFNALVADIVLRRDEIVAEVRSVWVDHAPSVYRAANSGSDPPPGWVDATADDVASSVLSAEEIRKRFSCGQTVSFVPIPSAAHVDRMRSERADRIRRLGAEREGLVVAFEKDIEEVFTERKAKVVGFVDDVQRQLSQTISDLTREVSEAVAGRGIVPARTAEKFRRVIAEARALNFIGDKTVTGWITAAETAVDTAEALSTEAAVASLTKTLTEISAEASRDVAAERRTDNSMDFVVRLRRPVAVAVKHEEV